MENNIKNNIKNNNLNDNSSQNDIERNPPIFTEFSEKTKKRLEKERIKIEKKFEKKKKKEEKKKELNEKYGKKVRNLLHEQFFGILDEERIHYTVFFFIGAIIIAIFSLFPNSGTWPITATEFVTLMFFIGFLVLMLFASLKSTSIYMFGPAKEWKYKILFMAIALAIGGILSSLFLIYTDASKMPVVFLQHDKLLPTLFIVVFIGWNVIQIHFIREGFETIAEKAEMKLIDNKLEEKKRLYARIFLALGLIFPFIIHFFTAWGFYVAFSDFADPSNPTQAELSALNIYWLWVVVSIILIIAMGFWQIQLYRKSIQNNRPNVFSNVFYMLLWILLWFRSFGFINSFLSTTKIASDIFIILGNVFLLSFTSILVLRGIAEKIKKGQVLYEASAPFLVYALTILYVAGQVALILEGFGTRDQVNMLNNSLVLIASFAYYFWYSNYVLQRKGFIAKRMLTKEEVANLLSEFSSILSKKLIQQKDVIDYELKQFLSQKNLVFEIKSENLESEKVAIEINENIETIKNITTEEPEILEKNSTIPDIKEEATILNIKEEADNINIEENEESENADPQNIID
ncbi:MAG: hypothetical protein ACTSRZ_07225 [Promethearchaeota archaeon]